MIPFAEQIQSVEWEENTGENHAAQQSLYANFLALAEKISQARTVPDDSIAILAVGWNRLIDLSSRKVYVLHDSILPRLRGWNPLVTALQMGHKEIGCSIISATEEIDGGDILVQSTAQIDYPIKIADAYLILKTCIERVIELFFLDFEFLISKAQKQDLSLVTYSLWRDERDYFINWNQSSSEITRFVNSVGFPYEGAACYVGKSKIRILDASIHSSAIFENASPGKIFRINTDNSIIVCSGDGLVRLFNLYNDDQSERILIKKLRTRLSSTPS